ncbi:monooxygenase (plasmid) [Sphingomonas panacis]|uniref:Monooxygenase n=2 Tax=Sphingomonas panacis TaxID=1560345 RepID=A0A1B3ZIR5_9SPHN|nr:NAD(P)/FAD-dependent oxidoreductase [Sphingomonas panacis]AOH87312.1 monooxygenase [Sphingomonas panacis]
MVEDIAKAVLLRLADAEGLNPDLLKDRYVAERNRRIVPTGNGQYTPTVEGAFANFGRDPWADPNFQRDAVLGHSEVIVAGAGFGGLVSAARLREAGCNDIRVIDEAGDFGGTWYWNRYPGAMCDIEAHIYLPLIEELGYAPKHRYSYAPEMLDVSQRAGRHYGLYEQALFQTSILDVRWLESEKHWLVETNRGDRLTCDILVMACGRQSLPKLPGIPGIDRFKGHAFHSSRWDYAYTGGDFHGGMTGLADKRVAVIGTGATAIQLIPEVAKDAKELLVFQRTPSSVGVRANRDTPPDYADRSRPGWQRERRYNFQSIISNIPQDQDLVGDGWTDFTRKIKPPTPIELAEQLGRQPTPEELKLVAEIFDYRVMNELRGRIDDIVADPETAELLKPWYRWFCKRPCFHDGYLETFNRLNVRLIDTGGLGVERISETGIVVDGVEYPIDCLIFATGFEANISYKRLTGFEVYGRGGLALGDHWTGGVRTLHGMMTDGFPNLFMVGGNQQTTAAVNAVHLIDEQAEHVAYIYRRFKELGLRQIEPTSDAVDDYVHIIRSSPANAALVDFYKDCTPGYYNAEGKATRSEDIFFGGRYGDGPIPFFRMLQAWRATGQMEGLTLGDYTGEHVGSGDYVSNIIS